MGKQLKPATPDGEMLLEERFRYNEPSVRRRVETSVYAHSYARSAANMGNRVATVLGSTPSGAEPPGGTQSACK